METSSVNCRVGKLTINRSPSSSTELDLGASHRTEIGTFHPSVPGADGPPKAPYSFASLVVCRSCMVFMDPQRNRTGEKRILAGRTQIHWNWNGVYRYTCLAVWIVSSAVMIIDRFYWNVWPRQTICSPGCGNDFFCSVDEVRWCGWRRIDTRACCTRVGAREQTTPIRYSDQASLSSLDASSMQMPSYCRRVGIELFAYCSACLVFSNLEKTIDDVHRVRFDVLGVVWLPLGVVASQ